MLFPVDKHHGGYIITFSCSLCHCRGLHHVLTTKGHRRGHFCVILLKHGDSGGAISDAAVFTWLFFWLILLNINITSQSVSWCSYTLEDLQQGKSYIIIKSRFGWSDAEVEAISLSFILFQPNKKWQGDPCFSSMQCFGVFLFVFFIYFFFIFFFLF